MHSKIIQVSNSPIEEDELLNENLDVYNLPHVDYLYDDISDFEKRDAINNLCENILPKGMLTLNDDGTATYTGGIKEWNKRYCQLIKMHASLVNDANVLDYIGPSYQLEKIIRNPLETSYLFYFHYDRLAEESADFMRFIATLNVGDTVYFGNVIGYHW